MRRMTRHRAVVLLIIVVMVAMAGLLPAGREQLGWWWAESRDQAADYTSYLETWPKGRHAVQARLSYDQRVWTDTKNAMIREAYNSASHASPEADAEYRREERLRRENFFWKQVTINNTAEGYKDYLQQYPHGLHVAEAQRQAALLNQEGNSNPSGQH
jgi:hypothetical protein